MPQTETLNVAVTPDLAAELRAAVAAGDYGSADEVVQEALRDWEARRASQLRELASLKADIDRGLADFAEGRVEDFDIERIIEEGRALSAGNSRSA